MDFTREPIIETVITPREGSKLVVRSSKSSGQEEYFVDAVEVVAFGPALFFRSLERPKAFLVPVSDYEILEVREARMVLKNVGVERAIKIGGGRETIPKLPKEVIHERVEQPVEEPALPEEAPLLAEGRLEKKRGRRHYRRRRGREETFKEGEPLETAPLAEDAEPHLALETPEIKGESAPAGTLEPTPSIILSSILPPPPTLISETIARYKDNAMFKGAFFVREEKQEQQEGQQEDSSQQESHKEAWISDEAEEEIFRHRASSLPPEEEPLPGITESHESVDANENRIPNGN